jgi:CRISPR-associated endonuclease/helicase Cas3
MSLALMLANPGVIPKSAEVDFDLVLHLVSAHHGWSRPLAPVAIDTDPIDVQFESDGVLLGARSNHGLERLDSGVSERFFRLVRRYGWFGLAWLEAILRLADHRRSESEQMASEEDAP